MGFSHFLDFPYGYMAGFFLAAALSGGLAAGLAASVASHVFASRLFRWKVLDHARKDIQGAVSAYMEWLATVSGAFAFWKTDLLPAFVPDSTQDQFELNRMRVLFVDQRGQNWLSKLEEYDALLGKFTPAIKAIWLRQMEIQHGFAKVFKCMESDPPLAVKTGERIENLAFDQVQLLADFLYHLQFECLRSVSRRRPRPPRDFARPRIIRTGLGRIRVIQPGDRTARL
jgi:hypothetical protein